LACSAKQLVLERLERPIVAARNQAFTAHDSGRFLEQHWSARHAAPTRMPSCSETTRYEAPVARGVATCGASTAAWGFPNRFSGLWHLARLIAPDARRSRKEIITFLNLSATKREHAGHYLDLQFEEYFRSGRV
jgi:hypothetical protein